MSGKMNRRRFLKAGAAAAGMGYFAVADVTESRAFSQNAPMNRLNIAVIGSGGQGGSDLNSIMNASPNENIVALCDVDDRRASAAYKRFPTAPKYKDYRIMLEKQKDIEAVVVGTPDHHHVFASIMAMKLGKHVYCEKPLTHSVWEARQMRDVAAKQKVATQMGNMGIAADGFRRNMEILRSGVIGDVREIHVWTDRPGTHWRQGMTKPLARQEIPKALDWEQWLGPAPERPFNEGYVPFHWRGWWDFGTGAIGDMACHIMNLAFMSLELGPPSTIEAVPEQPVNNQSPPNGVVVSYEFPARNKRPAVRLKWYEVRRPPSELLHGQKMSGGGSLFVGSKGSFFSSDDYGRNGILLPTKNFQDYKPPQPTIPRAPVGAGGAKMGGGPSHHLEWLRACKGGPPAMSNFVDYAANLTEIALLGNVAMRTGARINWDSTNLRATNLAAADQFIRREYRKGWSF